MWRLPCANRTYKKERSTVILDDSKVLVRQKLYPSQKRYRLYQNTRISHNPNCIKMDSKIVITGRVPSKKNSVGMMVRNGHVFKFPNSQYQQWHKDASLQLIGVKPIPTPCRIQIEFWYPDKRRVDNNNKAASILDLLTDNGIIPDDNTDYIPEELYICRGIDKLNPRAEISWIKM